MTLFQRSFLRYTILVVTLSFAAQVHSQAVFTVNGRLKIEGGDHDGTRVVVFKNGVEVRTITSGLNKFSLDLDLQGDYVLSFEKPGYVSKKLSFNTRVPADMVMTSFTPFEFAVSLFKQYSDVNVVVFNQPVGMIRYESGLGDFDYDTDYTRSIQKQMDQTLAEVERKQKEESARASANGKRKVAEARAQENAAAEAAREKEAAVKAKEEADRKAELERAAAARKAEEERQVAALKAAEEQKMAMQREEAERKLAAERVAAEKVAEGQRIEAERQAAAKARAEKERLQQEKQAEARRQAEAERRAAAMAELAKRIPPPAVKPPAPTERNLPAMVRREPIRTSAEPAVPAMAIAGEDQRRSITARMESEERPPAIDRTGSDLHSNSAASDVERSEELIVEPTKVMTIVKLRNADRITEYRKVIHKWGGTYYFRNDESISQVIYEKEALDEQLVDIQPRSKY